MNFCLQSVWAVVPELETSRHLHGTVRSCVFLQSVVLEKTVYHSRLLEFEDCKNPYGSRAGPPTPASHSGQLDASRKSTDKIWSSRSPLCFCIEWNPGSEAGGSLCYPACNPWIDFSPTGKAVGTCGCHFHKLTTHCVFIFCHGVFEALPILLALHQI